MTDSNLKLSEIKDFLKRTKLHLKVKNLDLDGTEESISFIDTSSKTEVCGKIVRSFTEGEVYHWPLLNHDNLAPLIDILDIRNDLCIYLTIDHQVTLKNIVHDEDFVYDPKCFNRKRSYAKDILSGLSYLHERSLSLMSLSDDNIVISVIHDRALITNFKYLACSRKITRSELHIPEMYMAPETEKGEFDAIKAEIWASGIMLLDMFLAHMVPWAIIDYKPKKVTQIVDKLSLELLQAANVGSVVSCIDLSKFQIFVKCFFKINPLARIPAKYASIASFLKQPDSRSIFYLATPKFQNINRKEIANEETSSNSSLMNEKIMKSEIIANYENELGINKSRTSVISAEQQKTDGLTKVIDNSIFYDESTNNHSNKNLLGENFRIPINQQYDSRCSENIMSRTERNKTNISKLEASSDVSSVKGQQPAKSKIIGEVDPAIAAKSFLSIKQPTKDNLTENSSSSFYETAENTIFDEKLSKLPKIAQNKALFNEDTKPSVEFDCNCYIYNPSFNQSKSLSFIKSNKKYDVSGTVSQQLSSRRNDCYSNEEFSASNQSVDLEISDIGLNHLFGNNSNPVVESDSLDVKTTKKSSGIAEIHPTQNKSEIRQKFSRKNECSISTQTSISCIRKSPSYSGTAPCFFIKPEIKSVVDKIVFLRKCYVCIDTHQRVFISKEFASRQQKFIREYRTLLHQESLRLREMLRVKHGLKFDDITKLIAFGNLRSLRNEPQRPVNVQNLVHKNLKSLRKERQGPMNVHNFVHGNKILQIQKAKDTFITDDTENDAKGKFKTAKTSCMRPQRNHFYYKAIQKPGRNSGRNWKLRVAPEDEKTKEEQEKIVLVTENKFNKELITVVATDEKITDKCFSAGMHEEMEKYREKVNRTERVNDLIKENAIGSGKTKRKDEKEKVKKTVKNKTEERVESNAKMRDKSKKKRKARKSDYKKLRKPKKSFFFSLCPGGKVEESTIFYDVFCEACKLKYEIS